MDFEKELRQMVRAAVMEEINNLSVRATIRAKIEEAGFTHDDIRKEIREMADSYFRSAMNGPVEDEIKRMFQAEISKMARKEIDAAMGSFTGWRVRDSVRDAITAEVKKVVADGFDVAVTITKKPMTE